MRHYIEQRSREWFELRIGRVTSTRLKTVAHGTLAAQTKLLDVMQFEVEHPDEAITKNMEGFGHMTPAAIRLGREREDWLIARFEIKQQFETGKRVKLDRPGFVVHPTISEFGCSPDWLRLRLKRSGEGKVRVDHAKHEFALKHGLLPEDKDQVYCQMMCCGFTEADYVSYCPDYPVIESRHCIVDVRLDQIYANFLYAELNRFLQHFRAGTRPSAPQVDSGVPDFFD
jgi:hypothetical protein